MPTEPLLSVSEEVWYSCTVNLEANMNDHLNTCKQIQTHSLSGRAHFTVLKFVGKRLRLRDSHIISYWNHVAISLHRWKAAQAQQLKVHKNMIIFSPSNTWWSLIFLQTFNIKAWKSIMVYSSMLYWNKTEQSHSSNNKYRDE